MAEQNLNERDAKLVQWLNEAHAKEAELEADLTAHITLTQKQSYKKRLQQHLKETRDHKRRVASRIRQLGGTATGPSVPGVPGAVGEVAGKAVAAVKGQVGAARAAITQQAETHVRNAQEELREEHVEIALYNRVEAFAEAVGDRETAQLARAIRRDEERMAKFLDAELKRLVKDVVRASVPTSQRPTGRRSTRRRASGATRASGAKRASGGKRTSGAKRTSGGSRSSGSRASSSRASGSRSSGSRTSGSRARSSSARSGSRTRASGGSRTRSSSSGSRSRSASRR